MQAIPNFQKQEGQPIFPSVLYNRPVTRAGAGRMLLVGGHASEFSGPTAINQLALAAGAGECRVIFPDKLMPLLGGAPGVFFGPSTNSGSLSREALGRILALAEEADVLALGTSLSNNSDTTLLIERLLSGISGPLILFDEAITHAKAQLPALAARPDTVFLLTMREVFTMCEALGVAVHIRHGAGLINKLEIIQALSAQVSGQIAVFGTEVLVAGDAKLIATPINYRLSTQPSLFYGVLGSFWLQNRPNRIAGLASGAYVIQQIGEQYTATDSPTATQLAKSITAVLKSQE